MTANNDIDVMMRLDVDSIEALMPLEALNMCIDPFIDCIYSIAYYSDMSTTLCIVYTAYTEYSIVEAPLDPIYSIRGILTIVEE